MGYYTHRPSLHPPGTCQISGCQLLVRQHHPRRCHTATRHFPFCRRRHNLNLCLEMYKKSPPASKNGSLQNANRKSPTLLSISLPPSSANVVLHLSGRTRPNLNTPLPHPLPLPHSRRHTDALSILPPAIIFPSLAPTQLHHRIPGPLRLSLALAKQPYRVHDGLEEQSLQDRLAREKCRPYRGSEHGERRVVGE